MRDLLLVVMVLMTGSCMHGHQYFTPSSAVLAKNVLDATVRIASDEGHGAGFFIGSTIIVTAAHVVVGHDNFAITTRMGETCAVKNAWADLKADIAIFQVYGCAAPDFLTISHDPAVGSVVMAAGHPLSTSWAVSDGIVAQTDIGVGGGSIIQITAPTQGGMSGGPVVNEHGHLVGMVWSIVTPDGMWAGVGRAISLGAITAALTQRAKDIHALG